MKGLFHKQPTISASITGVLISLAIALLHPYLALAGPLFAGFLIIKFERIPGSETAGQAAALGMRTGAIVGIVAALVPSMLWMFASIVIVSLDVAAPIGIDEAGVMFLASLFVCACILTASVGSTFAYLSTSKEEDEFSEENWQSGR